MAVKSNDNTDIRGQPDDSDGRGPSGKYHAVSEQLSVEHHNAALLGQRNAGDDLVLHLPLQSALGHLPVVQNLFSLAQEFLQTKSPLACLVPSSSFALLQRCPGFSMSSWPFL